MDASNRTTVKVSAVSRELMDKICEVTGEKKIRMVQRILTEEFKKVKDSTDKSAK